MGLALTALTGTLLLAAAPAAPSETPGGSVTIPNCLVTLIDEVEVPSQMAGVLQEISVTEGQQVQKDQPMAKIDDTQAVVLAEVAGYRLAVAQREAGNDINVRYAEAAVMVAAAELEAAQKANELVHTTIPAIEIQRLWLTVRQATLQIEQATHDLGIAEVTVSVRQAELKAAQKDIGRHAIKAPLDGIVVKRYRHQGEWVQPGEPVLRLVRMNRLRVEGFLNASRYLPSAVDGQPVTITVLNAPLSPEQQRFQGKITYVSPIVEAGSQFLVWAEVENRVNSDGQWTLRPGMVAEMRFE